MKHIPNSPRSLALSWVLAFGSLSSPAMAGKDVPLESVPAPVRATIDRETAGGVIDEIELDTSKDGETVYEVEFHLDGAKYEIEIATDGTLLKRSLD